MPKSPIKNIHARQILDSRGNPTVEVVVETASARGVFGVPSGASTGSAEALELRDGGNAWGGLGVERAVNNVNRILAKEIKGMNVFDQAEIDYLMIELDGTDNKKKLGANAILGVSGAVLKTAAVAKKVPVYKYVALLHKKKGWRMPKPMFNVINGGLHGDTNLNIQEFMLIPQTILVSESVRMASEIFHALQRLLKTRGLSTNLGNEGGFSPRVEYNHQALEMVAEAVTDAGYELGKDVRLALDVAASELYQEHDQQYVLGADKTSLSAERFVSMLKEWSEKYSIISIEDGLAEEDWSGWQMMSERLPKKIMQVGDDLFATQVARLQKGIELKVGNTILIKPNQVGTITETLATVALAQKNGYKVIASHRSGETTDDFIADFAVGVGADFLKAGSVARGERVAKYNRLMEIEQELK
jgi:enolase